MKNKMGQPAPDTAVAGAGHLDAMVVAANGQVLNKSAETVTAELKALAQQGPEAFLNGLHRIEFCFSQDFDWPWTRWKQLSLSGYDINAMLPQKIKGKASSRLANKILSRVIAVRSDNPERANLDDIFRVNPMGIADRAADLPFPFLVELMAYAFYLRRWKVLERLCRAVLARQETPHEDAVATRIHDLAFETLFFSIYRPGMPKYVADPEALVSRLEQLGNDPVLAHVTERRSVVSLVYRANCLAMRANFDKALALYQEAADDDGFRTPVFSQAQTLISIEKLLAAPTDELDEWRKSHIKTEHHFRHVPADQKEHAILVACEGQYLDLFGDLYVEILSLTNPGALVHFHFVNLDKELHEIEARMDEWQARFDIRTNFSIEKNKIMADMPSHRGGICVCTRYIHLPDYLEVYSGVSITDIDGWLEAPVSYLSDFAGADTKISSWVWRKNPGFWRLPWGNLAGGYISFASTEATKAFADIVARYLLTVFKRNAYAGKSMFYADQAGVFLCMQHAVRAFGMKVGHLEKGFAQSEEQRFGARHEGKQKAMKAKIEALRKSRKPSRPGLEGQG